MTKVLLVDDDADILRIGELGLRLGGLAVVTASSGADAVSALQAERPDIVVLDVMMPGMDGLQTLRELRALPEATGIPIVFLTASVQQSEVEAYVAQGAAGVIKKPFQVMDLAEQVRSYVG